MGKQVLTVLGIGLALLSCCSVWIAGNLTGEGLDENIANNPVAIILFITALILVGISLRASKGDKEELEEGVEKYEEVEKNQPTWEYLPPQLRKKEKEE